MYNNGDGTNSVYSCGYNNNGQLGLGNTISQKNLTLIPLPNTQLYPNIKPINVACGQYHTIILYNNGNSTNTNSVYSCGYNNYGQLGLSNIINKYDLTLISLPNTQIYPINVACGAIHTIILYNNGDGTNSVYGCGYNVYGQLGIGNTTNQSNLTLILLPKSNIYPINIACGINHTIILYNNGDGTNSVYGCGDNSHGQLGLGNISNQNLTLIPLPKSNINPINIACGANHTIILYDNGNGTNSVYSCGDNTYGQLGLFQNSVLNMISQPNDLLSNSKSIKSVNSQNHTIILYDTGDVYSCGNNNYGQLGVGDTSNRYTLTKITSPSLKAKNIACGYDYTLILYDNGDNTNSIYACGNNNNGQLGLGNTSILNLNNLTLIPLPEPNINPINMVCSSQFTLILYDNGDNTTSVYAYGVNTYGQLGLNNTASYSNITKIPLPNPNINPINIACGSNHIIILYDDGNVYSCGNNAYGQLGLNDTTDRYILTQITLPNTTLYPNIKAINIACGVNHTIILYDNDDGTNSVYSCGDNTYGQLGLGDNNTYIEMTQIISPNLNPISIICGYNHTMITYDNGDNTNSVYACGNNTYGQLGNSIINTNLNGSLTQMTYYNKTTNTILPFNIASNSIFSVMIFNKLQKTYDRLLNITLSNQNYKIYTFMPLQNTISITSYSAILNDKNVGTNKLINLIINTLTNNINNKTNYIFVKIYNILCDITKLLLNLTYQNTTKDYDGVIDVPLNFSIIPTNIISGDKVYINYISATYNTENPGNNKPITINGVTLIGYDSKNYNILSTLTTFGSIIENTNVNNSSSNIPKFILNINNFDNKHNNINLQKCQT